MEGSTHTGPAALSTESLASLVLSDRVHRRVYTDPAVFELEMDRIFGRCWIFLAHESQIANPGDYVLARLGREEVVVTRDEQGAVHGLINRCAHRGARLCSAERGHTPSFICPYHAWQYRLDGSLLNVPYRQGFPKTRDWKDPRLSLARVARVDAYRGLIFGNLAADGPGLEEYLGPMTAAIDNLVDRAPDGEIEQAGGVFRLEYRGNWKMHNENANDVMHAGYVHESSVTAARNDRRDYREPAFDGHHTHTQLLSNAFSLKEWQATGLWSTEGGHSYMGGFYRSGMLSPERDDPVWRDYRARLVLRHGEAKTRAILGLDRFNNLIYPNLTLNAQYQQIRVARPRAVDRTEIIAMCFRLKGAPEELFHGAVRFLSNIGSPASIIFTDDVEIFQRCQAGFRNTSHEWVDLARGLGREKPVGNGVIESDGTSEMPQRAQYLAWLSYMTSAGA